MYLLQKSTFLYDVRDRLLLDTLGLVDIFQSIQLLCTFVFHYPNLEAVSWRKKDRKDDIPCRRPLCQQLYGGRNGKDLLHCQSRWGRYSSR